VNKIRVKFLAILLLVWVPLVSAKVTLKVSIPAMSAHTERPANAILEEFTEIMAQHMGVDVQIEIVPFVLSMQYVLADKVDIHLPLIQRDFEGEELGFVYSDVTLYQVNFVLYSRNDCELSLDNLSSYTIETDKAHQNLLPFTTTASTCILCSLKRVQKGIVDGYIFADASVDPLLKTNLSILPDLKRTLYKTFNVKIVFPNAKVAQALNAKVSKAVNEMKQNGELERLVSLVAKPFSQIL